MQNSRNYMGHHPMDSSINSIDGGYQRTDSDNGIYRVESDMNMQLLQFQNAGYLNIPPPDPSTNNQLVPSDLSLLRLEIEKSR